MKWEFSSDNPTLTSPVAYVFFNHGKFYCSGFPSSEKKLAVILHMILEYKHPSFDYTWSYKKKKNCSRWLYAGISTVQKMAALQKKTKKYIYYRSWQTKTVLSAWAIVTVECPWGFSCSRGGCDGGRRGYQHQDDTRKSSSGSRRSEHPTHTLSPPFL